MTEISIQISGSSAAVTGRNRRSRAAALTAFSITAATSGRTASVNPTHPRRREPR
jgi:hypothetical protein